MNDLPEFGVDFDDYVQLKCISENQESKVLIDNKVVYKMEVPKTSLKIKGITIHFQGAGSVKDVEFKKNGAIVHASNF